MSQKSTSSTKSSSKESMSSFTSRMRASVKKRQETAKARIQARQDAKRSKSGRASSNNSQDKGSSNAKIRDFSKAMPNDSFIIRNKQGVVKQTSSNLKSLVGLKLKDTTTKSLTDKTISKSKATAYSNIISKDVEPEKVHLAIRTDKETGRRSEVYHESIKNQKARFKSNVKDALSKQSENVKSAYNKWIDSGEYRTKSFSQSDAAKQAIKDIKVRSVEEEANENKGKEVQTRTIFGSTPKEQKKLEYSSFQGRGDPEFTPSDYWIVNGERVPKTQEYIRFGNIQTTTPSIQTLAPYDQEKAVINEVEKEYGKFLTDLEIKELARKATSPGYYLQNKMPALSWLGEVYNKVVLPTTTIIADKQARETPKKALMDKINYMKYLYARYGNDVKDVIKDVIFKKTIDKEEVEKDIIKFMDDKPRQRLLHEAETSAARNKIEKILTDYKYNEEYLKSKGLTSDPEEIKKRMRSDISHPITATLKMINPKGYKETNEYKEWVEEGIPPNSVSGEGLTGFTELRNKYQKLDTSRLKPDSKEAIAAAMFRGEIETQLNEIKDFMGVAGGVFLKTDQPFKSYKELAPARKAKKLENKLVQSYLGLRPYNDFDWRQYAAMMATIANNPKGIIEQNQATALSNIERMTGNEFADYISEANRKLYLEEKKPFIGTTSPTKALLSLLAIGRFGKIGKTGTNIFKGTSKAKKIKKIIDVIKEIKSGKKKSKLVVSPNTIKELMSSIDKRDFGFRSIEIDGRLVNLDSINDKLKEGVEIDLDEIDKLEDLRTNDPELIELMDDIDIKRKEIDLRDRDSDDSDSKDIDIDDIDLDIKDTNDKDIDLPDIDTDDEEVETMPGTIDKRSAYTPILITKEGAEIDTKRNYISPTTAESEGMYLVDKSPFEMFAIKKKSVLPEQISKGTKAYRMHKKFKKVGGYLYVEKAGNKMDSKWERKGGESKIMSTMMGSYFRGPKSYSI